MTERQGACPFCDRIERGEYEEQFSAWAVRFEPLNPVVPGHQLIVPDWHAEHPDHMAVRAAMNYAAVYAARQGGDFNLITSSGPAATQTIPHIHVHYVPRRKGDGLHLPWTGQRERTTTCGPRTACAVPGCPEHGTPR
ncbi:HIT family protein [Nocardia otitidiscaviarum]|uniref:HIT family protein n=1 Tax=Nocardia otitidiscaviarum TaxID=1823 RepID=UPI0007C80AFB|nr:HIT family protein [Nocardia otitidiscaviarum]